ncbi:WGR domain-containing protein [Agrobacterium fabrum]|uniref:WGR domain-containing protein n=1 Tax=Agrobacterium fabrum TaxID=1176649 RepID=UPI002157BABE|nr:WGR domain-containing protein [Agrobacterium fabrum]MCR6727853.1 WGR domain-containing protein [Agrobacterium fabrum]
MTISGGQPAVHHLRAATVAMPRRRCHTARGSSRDSAETACRLRERSGARVEPSGKAGSPDHLFRDCQHITQMNRSGITDSNLSLDLRSVIDDPPGMITQPYQLYIERTDASMNMARYYAMDISETLFGETRLTRRWGRIGVHGQSKAHIFLREEDAVQLFLDLVRQKRTRGYRPAERGPLARTSTGVLSAPAPIGLEGDLDVDEKRDLDRELEAELSFAEEVAGDFAESAKPSPGACEELEELAHGVYSFR